MQEEKSPTEEQQAAEAEKKNAITANIIERTEKVKIIAEQLISLLQEQELTEANLEAAFDLLDGIQTESEESIMLTYDLKDLLHL